MIYKEILLRDNQNAKMVTYILDKEVSYKKYKKRPLIFVCPGGAYLTLAAKEGETIAARLLGLGYHVIVLKYTTYFLERPTEINPNPVINSDSHFPEQLFDIMKAMSIVKNNAEEWYIDTDQVYTLGFSAGAHLVGMYSVNWNKADYLEKINLRVQDVIKPAGQILAYPMLSTEVLVKRDVDSVPNEMRQTIKYSEPAIFGGKYNYSVANELNLLEQINTDLPRTFIWQPMKDTVVDPLETLQYALNLKKVNVSVEAHFFEQGGHGMALCDETTALSEKDIDVANAVWINLLTNWLKQDSKVPELISGE